MIRSAEPVRDFLQRLADFLRLDVALDELHPPFARREVGEIVGDMLAAVRGRQQQAGEVQRIDDHVGAGALGGDLIVLGIDGDADPEVRRMMARGQADQDRRIVAPAEMIISLARSM